MKFAVASDLHIDVTELSPPELGIDDESGIDFCIIAGDLHPDESRRGRWLADLELYINAPVLFVPGNHDYWSSPILKPCRRWSVQSRQKPTDVVEVAGATLWTDIKSPLNWVRYRLDYPDYKHMYTHMDWEEDDYRRAHSAQRQFLLTSGARIIVSHHAPSNRSIEEKYVGHPMNFAYVNQLDGAILDLPNPPDFWVHAHLHSECDYNIGKTRVICHPRGYRWESTFKDYTAKIFTL